jgi:DHA1 family bicyclomycin/chloramphenicol resistance-like MFS transporter
MSSSESLPRRLPGWLILMGALTAIGPFSTDMYLPAFPAMAEGLHTTLGEIERTLAIYLVGLALSQMAYGSLADRYGRKRPLICGLALYTLSSIGCALAGDVQVLLACRVLQALGAAAGMVVPRAVVRDHYSTQGAARALSMMILVMGLAPILAPLAGGQLVGLGWRSLFWTMAALGLTLLVAVILVMRESLAPENVVPLNWRVVLGNYSALLKHRGFMAHSLAGGLCQAGMFAYIAGSPHLFIQVYGVPVEHYGLFFGSNAAILIIGAQLSAHLLRRHTSLLLQRRALTVLALAALAGLAMALSGVITLWLAMAFIQLYMFSNGFVNPNSAALALSEQGRRLGAASAVLGTLQYSCAALASTAISLWQIDSALPLTTIMTGCACLGWFFGRVARGGAADHAPAA